MAHTGLVNAQQVITAETTDSPRGRAQACDICQCLWCKQSHSSQFQAMTSVTESRVEKIRAQDILRTPLEGSMGGALITSPTGTATDTELTVHILQYVNV